MSLQVKPLGKTLGAEILGVDLSEDIDDQSFSAIREAWLQHKVVVFHQQHLSETGLMRFGRRFGELEIHVRSTFHSKHNPEVMVVSNKKEEGKAIGVLGDGEAKWHIDQLYMPQPTFGTILFGEEIPDEGGDTYFADLATAYERLPVELRDRIGALRGVSSVDRHNKRDAEGRPDLQMSQEQLKRAPDSVHPMVRTHPVVGRKSVYYSPSHTAWVEGRSEAESQPLFDALLPYMTDPDLIYRHHWRLGDVVMWDNTSVMHRRDPFPGHYSRLLKRVSFKYPPEHRVPV